MQSWALLEKCSGPPEQSRSWVTLKQRDNLNLIFVSHFWWKFFLVDANVQPTLRTIVSKVIIPLLNVKLGNGFPLPVIPAVDLENADIRYEEGYIFICSDVHYKGGLIKSIQLPANDALLWSISVDSTIMSTDLTLWRNIWRQPWLRGI